MKWINIINLSENDSAKCPCCGSEETGYYAERISGKMGFITIYCNSCKKGFNISRAEISDEMLKKSAKPDFTVNLTSCSS